MPYVERTNEEIIAAWKEYVGRHPEPDRKIITFIGLGDFSPREMVQKVEEGDELFIMVFVEGARKIAREKGEDPVAKINSWRKSET